MNQASKLFLGCLPWVVITTWLALLFHPATRDATVLWISTNREFNAVEMGTFLGFLIAAIFAGCAASTWAMQVGPKSMQAVTLTLVALSALWLMLEAIFYGQHFIGFTPPDFITGPNRQNELNFHNMPGLHGKAAYLYLIFCIAAVIGSLKQPPGPLSRLYSHNDWRDLRVPSQLYSSITSICFLTAFGLLPKLFEVSDQIGLNVRWTNEITELMIAVAAAGYRLQKLITRPTQR